MFWSISVDSPFPSGRFIVINRDCTSFPGVVLQLHQHNQHTNPKHPTRALTVNNNTFFVETMILDAGPED